MQKSQAMYKTSIILAMLMVVSAFTTLDAQNLNQIQRGQRGYSPPPLDREQGAISIENTVVQVDEKMELYAVEFELDAFEKAVMKNYLVDFETEKMAILENENVAYDIKEQSVLRLNENLREKLGTMLSEDELNRFAQLHFGPKQKKKKRKKKKNRDKTQ
ncbi:MAG: hypothetical protein ABJM06_05495 [Gilvibacter sp.]